MFDFMNQGDISLKDVQKSIQELPLPEKIRALAIYKRYKIIREVEEEMNKKNKAIEKEYLKLDIPVLQKVSGLVQGKKVIQESQLKDLDKYLTKQEQQKVKQHIGSAKRIPDYWLKVLKNAAIIKQRINKEDESALKHLEDIRVQDEEGTDNFTIIFEFSENQFFTNTTLTKKFFIKNDIAYKAEASTIQWKGKSLTVKQIKKKQKNKKTGQQRVITKLVQNKSFFVFFRNIEALEINEMQATEEQLQTRQKLDDDFEMGGMLVDDVLPYSLEYYLGVEHEGDEDMDLDDDDDDEDSDDDAPKKGSKSKQKSKSKGKNKETKKPESAEEKPQCKNQ